MFVDILVGIADVGGVGILWVRLVSWIYRRGEPLWPYRPFIGEGEKYAREYARNSLSSGFA